MRAVSRSNVLLLLLATSAGAWTPSARAQAFSADYGLLNFGVVAISPNLQSDTRFSGAGLSLAAGRNWFAQVAVGRGLQQPVSLSGANAGDALSIGGGYRWGDGQSMSLQVTGGHGADRLGLSVRYDWPRYFVRLSYDSRINPLPADTLRFSAGVRF